MTASARRLITVLTAASLTLAVLAAPAHATWAAPQEISSARTSVAASFNARTGMTTISRLIVTKLATGTAYMTCADRRGTCPETSLTERNTKAQPFVTWNLVRVFGASHPVGPGAVIRLVTDQEGKLARTVIIRTRAKAAPLISYGCQETIPGALRSCSSAGSLPVSKRGAGEIRAALTEHTKTTLGALRAIRVANAGPTRYALATYAVNDGSAPTATALLTRQFSDTGEPPTAWKVEWLTRSAKPASLCRIPEQPRELWFPRLADPAICA